MLKTIAGRRLMLLLALSILLLAACQNEDATPTTAAAAPTPTATAMTEDAAPTATSEPPTATPVPPTATPAPPTKTPAPTATPAPAYPIDYETADCEFVEPAGYDIECGYLTVPEQRALAENGRTVRLHVAVFKSTSANPAPDPIVYLEGGPGGDALEAVPLSFNSRFSPFLADRDFIMFDQRGTGYSQPSLACPEVTDITFELLELDLEDDEATARAHQAYFDCFDRLAAEGVNFAAYNSAENAADVADLRRALGYEEWNLYGISYGTRLAQTIIRDDAAGVRSVILDSTYPLEANILLEASANLDRAFAVFFAGCAADPACNAAYADLETVFYDLVDSLNETPATITVTNLLTGERYETPFGGYDLMGLLFQSLYSAEVIPVLPQVIYEVNDGDYDTVGLLFSSFLLNVDYVSAGMQYAVQCYDEATFTEPGAPAAALAEYPATEPLFEDSFFFSDNIFTVCARLAVDTAPALENEPVNSDLPILVLAGEYDPITPPAWGEIVADHFPNSYYFVFPGLGHGVSVSGDCPLRLTRAFLDDPTSPPDDSCLTQMSGPAFAVPGAVATSVALVPFESDIFGIVLTGVIPEGWEEIQPGTFARQQTALDQAALVQQAAPNVTPELFLSLLTGQLGLDDNPPTANGTYQGGGHEWLLYEAEFQGNHIDIALAEGDGVTFVVVLISPEGEEALFYEAILLPVLDALTTAA